MQPQNQRLSVFAESIINHEVANSATEGEICGWVSGRPDEPLACRHGQRCAVDADRRLVGCCWPLANGDCSLSTRCLETRSRPKAPAGELADRSLDLACAPGSAPYCKTDVFADDGMLGGFSLYVCGADRITETIFRSTITTSDGLATSSTTVEPFTTSRSRASIPSRPPAATASSVYSPTSSSAVASSLLFSGPSAPSISAATAPGADSSSSAPGPWTIAGVALGGAGGLVLVATSAWLTYKLVVRVKVSRQKRQVVKNEDVPSHGNDVAQSEGRRAWSSRGTGTQTDR